MAFVYRTVDKQNTPKPHVPGPGAYFKPKKHIESHEPQHSVPFNHSQNRQIWKMHQVPGPGAYDTQSMMKKQKKLVADPLNHVVIYETPSESVAFKSKTIRFTANANSNNPGPGEYETEPEVVRPQSGFKKPQIPSSQLKQFLKQKNNLYKSNDDQFTNLKGMIVSGNDEPFAESYVYAKNNQQENRKQSKNSLFFASKVQRDINRIRPQTSAGPGSYNIAKSSFEIQKRYSKKSPVKSICIDKRVQKIQIEEVGPGYYELDQAFKTLNQTNPVKKKKIQCFGSTVDRFQIVKTDSQLLNPGPATYSLLTHSANKSTKCKTPGTSFPKEQRKIFQPPKSAVLPISYNTDQNVLLNQQSFSPPKNQNINENQAPNSVLDLPNKDFVKKKIQMLNLRTFASIKVKLKQKKFDENKAKQTNFYRTLLNTRQKKKRFEENISSSQPKIQVNPVIDRPLCYDNETNTFASKYNYKTQKDAPFMSCAQRFKDQNQQKFIDLDLNESKRSKRDKKQRWSQQHIAKLSKNKKQTDGKVGWMAVSKDERFKYATKKEPVSPQYYDPILPQKRSYNVLFTQGK